jgi:signal peptidase I
MKAVENGYEMIELGKGQLHKKGRKRFVIIALGITVLIIICMIIRFGFTDVIISSSSMEPVLKKGWAYRVSKFAYWNEAPQRGDIIVIHHSNKSIGSMVKRIIALPGEKIQIKDGYVYINDKLLKVEIEFIEYGGCAEEPINLGKDEYFVLGDNFDESFDSRYEEFGLVHRKNITGKITGTSRINLFLQYLYDNSDTDEE